MGSLSPVPERRQLQMIKALKAINCLSLNATSKLTNCPILTCRYVLESLELALQERAMGFHKGQDLQVLIRPDCRVPESMMYRVESQGELPEPNEEVLAVRDPNQARKWPIKVPGRGSARPIDKLCEWEGRKVLDYWIYLRWSQNPVDERPVILPVKHWDVWLWESNKDRRLGEKCSSVEEKQRYCCAIDCRRLSSQSPEGDKQ